MAKNNMDGDCFYEVEEFITYLQMLDSKYIWFDAFIANFTTGLSAQIDIFLDDKKPTGKKYGDLI